jgi:hypothetical protein
MALSDLTFKEKKLIGAMHRKDEGYTNGDMQTFSHYQVTFDHIEEAGTTPDAYKALLDKAGFKDVRQPNQSNVLIYSRDDRLENGPANVRLHQQLRDMVFASQSILSNAQEVRVNDTPDTPSAPAIEAKLNPQITKAEAEQYAQGVRDIYGAEVTVVQNKPREPVSIAISRMGNAGGEQIDVLQNLRESAQSMIVSQQWRETNAGANGGIRPRLKVQSKFGLLVKNTLGLLGIQSILEPGQGQQASTVRIEHASIPAFKAIPGIDVVEYVKSSASGAGEEGLHYGGFPPELDGIGEFASEKQKVSWASEQRARAASRGPRTPAG